MAQKKATPPRKSRRGGKKYRTFTVFVFSCLLIYLLGYSIVFFNRPSVALETVDYGTIDVPTTLRGLIIRQEQVVTSPRAGQPEYFFLEGERMKKNALVCTVKDAQQAPVIESEIAKLDESIVEAQKQREDFSIFKEDLDNIQKNMDMLVDSNITKFIGGNVSELYSFVDQLNTQMNLRNQIWLTENSKSTAALSEEKAAYETQLAGSISQVYTDSSGIFSLRIDHFEDIATPEARNAIDRNQVEMQVQPEYISKSLAVEEGDPLFKVITSNQWYLVSFIPKDIAAQWETGDKLQITSTINEEIKQVDMTVESMTQNDTDVYVVFASNENILDFADARTIDFYVEENIYSGFKIPNEAIVEKNFIKIPNDYVVESLDGSNVIKREGDTDKLIAIDIASSDEDNVYILQDFGTLKIGDTLVSEGENPTTYMLSEVKTYQGVYVANSSMASFTVVEPLGSNADYTIVSAESQYGLKIYDKIVSDAKTVEESETVN